MNCYRCATPIPDNSRFCLSCGADVSGETAERTQAVDPDPGLQQDLQSELGTDFLIDRELGRGGMAVVFLATDVHLGRKVAVKVLPPEFTRLASGGMVERFKREARTSATLDHPHVIPIFRVSTGGKLFWYVMKYLEGEALDDLLKREHQLPFARAADILKQTAEALAYAHRKNVIHRDVKPANVMLDENGWVTVTDFGIAKALDTSSLTGSGSMIGTPYYMSPEQCSGTKVTGASDQYSLAVMAYQMVSGHLPFTGETVVEIIKKHCMEPPPPLAVLRPTTPPALVAVVERALAKSPEERFPSVTEFARAFESAACGAEREAPERTAETPVARQRPSATALASPLPAAPPPRATPAPRRRRLLLAGTVGAVSVAGGLGVALWRPWDGGVVRTPTPAATAPPASEVGRPAPAPPSATPAPLVAQAPPLVQRQAQRAAAGRAQPTPTQTSQAGEPGNTALISVGSRPLATLTVNGRPVPNPASGHLVPAGPVELHFVVSDSTGIWSFDTTVTVAAGEHVNMRRITLVRRP